MKKTIALSLALITSILLLVSCSPAFSDDYYNEISSYVKLNADYLEASEDLEYFFYDEVNESATKSYYGYYYAKDGGRYPYISSGMTVDKTAVSSKDGGFYFGEASDENDWCFIKAINKNWFYFESHDYIYN